MRNYREVTESLFKRREEYLTKKKKRQRMLYYGITTLCVVSVISIGLYLPQKPQEAIIPHSHSTNFSTPSSETICLDSNCSQAITTTPSYSSSVSSFPDFQNTATSLPEVQQQENTTSVPTVPSMPVATLPELPSSMPPIVSPPDVSSPESTSSTTSSSVPSIPTVSSVPEVSLPEVPSSAPSSPASSKPQINYTLDFSNLQQFSSFLPQLDIQIDSSKVVDTTIPEITTPEPNKNFWGYSANDGLASPSPGGDAEVNATPSSPSSPSAPSDEAIWNEAKSMFDSGYYNVPYLQNGNELLRLVEIYIQKNTIKYNYRFQSDVSNTTSSDLLSVQLYDYSIESTISNYYQKYDYKILEYNGVSYTTFRMDDTNMYDACIIWKQNGFWCRANYRGNDMYLSSIIPNLYLIQLPWTQ